MFLEVGADSNVVGELNESFASVLNLWTRHYFPQVNKAPEAKQKKYTRCMLKKPHGGQVKQVVTRIQQMNSLLLVFPGTDNTILSEPEVIDIIVSMFSMAWRTSMARMNF